MVDKEIWAEALNLAKDQLRHGKVHFSELEVVAKSIYEKLCALKCGPDAGTPVEPQKEEEPVQKHEKSRKSVKCAICGKEVKTLTERHTRSHGLTKKEYMDKFGVSKKDMSVKSARKTTSGEDNPLNQMYQIMKEFDIKRGEVKNFVTEKGFDGLKGLSASAKEKGVGIVELLKEADAQDSKGNKKK
jgi:predicted transcriptional regulator